ncbi:MAG TPA: twin-arginine translocase subunit TatC [Thermoanaerobaculia bacterium]|nr:twin-arginine translocase subunit TatC [Thermoanaerobaculia bacterium]
MIPTASQRQPPPRTPTAEELSRMSLMEHLEEMRKRIFYSLIALFIAFLPCWVYVQRIFDFLAAPLQKIQPGMRLAFLGLTDPFILYFKVAALAAVFVAAPFLLFQLWQFVAPGLYRKERMLAFPFVFFTTMFFLSGGAFAYYVAFPFAARFLLSMGQNFQAVITIEKYFGFLLTVILGLGLMFELPVLILLLSLIGVVTPRFLLRYFKHAVVIIFIIAAIITPTPDVVNLCIFAVPAIGLYLLGVGAAFFAERFRKKKDAEMAEDGE